jgi:hypothetical protein
MLNSFEMINLIALIVFSFRVLSVYVLTYTAIIMQLTSNKFKIKIEKEIKKEQKLFILFRM